MMRLSHHYKMFFVRIVDFTGVTLRRKSWQPLTPSKFYLFTNRINRSRLVPRELRLKFLENACCTKIKPSSTGHITEDGNVSDI